MKMDVLITDSMEEALNTVYHLADLKIDEIELEGKQNEQSQKEYNKLVDYKIALCLVDNLLYSLKR